MKHVWLLALVACSSQQTAKSEPKPVTAIAAAKPAGKSRVELQHFSSEALGVEKHYVVYLPAGYDDNPSTRWPVFYYLHGLTGNERNWTERGKLDVIADGLGLQAIVVMPDGDDGFYVDGVAPVDYDTCLKDGTGLFMPELQNKRETCVRARRYETYITKDLVGHIDATLRTNPKREARAIAGLSMGGFGALMLAMRHPDLFTAAASHSGVDSLLYKGPYPYVSGKGELITDLSEARGNAGPELGRWFVGLFGTEIEHWKQYDPTTLVQSLQPGTLALYLDCGTEDGFRLQNGAAFLHDLLLARHIDHAFFLGPGQHDFEFWSRRLPESLKFLRDHVAKPAT